MKHECNPHPRARRPGRPPQRSRMVRVLDHARRADQAGRAVERHNLYRRHLTESQRAMIGAKIKKIYEGPAHERMESGKGLDGSGGRGHKINPMENFPEGLDVGDSRDKAAADQVHGAAKGMGHSSYTLRTAKEALGIIPYREGFGPGAVWYWKLPTIDAN
jgi:hypothetical protein